MERLFLLGNGLVGTLVDASQALDALIEIDHRVIVNDRDCVYRTTVHARLACIALADVYLDRHNASFTVMRMRISLPYPGPIPAVI
jgi:hypothetical protein